MDNKIKYGIIGSGNAAWLHAKAVSSIPNAELVAISDVILDKASKLADEFGVASVYADYHDILARDDIQIVSVCTPSGTHSEIGSEAATSGKHVVT